MNVLIVAINSERLAHSLEEKLPSFLNSSGHDECLVVAVVESGAGEPKQALGPLSAYLLARKKIRASHGLDILSLQRDGAAVAVYRTTNDKTALRELPTLKSDGSLLTILEAVILQTYPYVKKAGGRLSVYATNQLFCQLSAPVNSISAHITLFVKGLGNIAKEEFTKRGIDKYSLTAQLKSGRLKTLGRLGSSSFARINDSLLFRNSSWMINLGSYCLSYAMTTAFLEEFAADIANATKTLNDDAYLWMPLTLDPYTYSEQTPCSKNDVGFISRHYERMNRFKNRFCSRHDPDSFLGIRDIGSEGIWWDLSDSESYYDNIIKLAAGGNSEGSVMRHLLNLQGRTTSINSGRFITDEDSILINCNIRSGIIKNSVLVGVNAKSLEVSKSVIINSNFSTLKTEESFFYNAN